MRLSEGVEWALHACTVLAYLPPGVSMPASRLAEFHGVPPAYLAKHLQGLAKAGIVDSVPGPRGGYRLARSPDDISFLDVVQAVEGATSSFRCTEIRQRGPAAAGPREYGAVCAIAQAMHRADRAWREELRQQTVGAIVRDLADQIPAKTAARAASWMQEVMR